jgi:two-component system OmpR family sensor kinase
VSLRGRLLVAMVVVLATGLLTADVVTYVALRSALLTQLDARLLQAGETLEHNTERSGRGGPRDRGDARSVANLSLTVPGFFVQTRDSSGKVTQVDATGDDGNAYAPALPAVLPVSTPRVEPNQPPSSPGPNQEPSADDAVFDTLAATDAAGPSFRVRYSVNKATGETIIVGLPLSELQKTLGQLVVIEALVSAAVLVLSGAAGLWLVRVGLRPLDDIGDTAAHIAAGDLSRRVERSDDRTEVGRLGTSLNEMLGQIETAFSEREASEAALRSSEERLRRFVGDASHELRTPLAAIQAYAELFARGADQHPEDLPRLMRNIHKECLRMSVLVDDLLLLTRLDQGRPLERKPVDLGAIAYDTVEAGRAMDPDRPIDIAVDGLVEVQGDRTRLRQISDNLLLNARLHTPPGTPVEIRVSQRDGFGVLHVIDHGPGIEPDVAAKVFERFYRGDPSRSRADGGSGLGLSIVQAIAQAHGGRAETSPTPGGGATFTIEIPLLDANGTERTSDERDEGDDRDEDDERDAVDETDERAPGREVAW